MLIDFNRGWTFSKKGMPETATAVNLPHDAMITETRCRCINGGNSGYFPGGNYIYEKAFEVTPDMLGKYVALFFEGVYRLATVYLNGEEIAFHAYGYTEFEIDISDKIVEGTNIVSVDVWNNLEPNSRWYSGSGIYRPVSLVVKDKHHLKDVVIMTKQINPAIINVTASEEADVEIYDGETLVASGKTGDIEIPNAKLWDDLEPNLYRAVIKIPTDTVEETFGIRTITYSAKTGVLINGREVKFRGACIHHDNGVLGACDFEDASDRRIRILKEGGFNAIRSAHNPCSREILRACDKYGVYIMDESFDMWYTPKTHHDYSRDFWDNYKDDIAAMVKKDINHPAVVMYSIGNENSEFHDEKGMELAKEQADLIRSIDSTRIVTIGANLMLALMNNIYKDEGGEYKREPLTEATGITKKMENTGSAGFNLMMSMIPKLMANVSKKKGCGDLADKLDEFIDIVGLNYGDARYEMDFASDPNRMYVGSETFAVSIYDNWNKVEKYHQLIGDFVWTGWDYIGEAGSCGAWDYFEWGELPLLDGAGTIDICGYRTVVNYYMQICNGTYKNAYIGVAPVNYVGKKYQRGGWRFNNYIHSWSWQGYEGVKTTVEVYGKGVKAELFLNGKSLGTKKIEKNIAKFSVKYAPGTLSAKVYDANGNVWGEDKLITSGNETVMNVSVDKKTLNANGQDLSYVFIEMQDANGTYKPCIDKDVTVTIEGDAVTLQGLGSARTRTDEVFDKDTHGTNFGQALAVLRAGYDKGVARVTVSAEGVAPVVFDVEVK